MISFPGLQDKDDFVEAGGCQYVNEKILVQHKFVILCGGYAPLLKYIKLFHISLVIYST